MSKRQVAVVLVILWNLGNFLTLAYSQSLDEHFPLPDLDVITAENADRVQHLGTLKGFSDWTLYAAFSPDGHLVAATGWHDGARIWDIHTGNLLRTIDCPPDPVDDQTGGIAFSPDGLQIAVACENTVLLWNISDLLQTSEVHSVGVLEGDNMPLGKITINQKGTYLAARGIDAENEEILLWDIEKREKIAVYNGKALCCPNFSPDGSLLAYSNGEKTILVNMETLEETSNFPFPSQVFSTDWAMSADTYGADARLWRVENETFPTLLEEENYIAGVLAFNPDGSVLASGGDFKLLLWNTATAKLSAAIQYGGFSGIVFSPDGKLIVTTHASAGGAYSDVHLWGIPQSSNS